MRGLPRENGEPLNFQAQAFIENQNAHNYKGCHSLVDPTEKIFYTPHESWNVFGMITRIPAGKSVYFGSLWTLNTDNNLNPLGERRSDYGNEKDYIA